MHLGHAAPPHRPRSNRDVDGAWDLYFEVLAVADLAEELRRRGTTIVRGPESTEYGRRELDVVDADGYLLCFSEDEGFDPDEPIGVLHAR